MSNPLGGISRGRKIVRWIVLSIPTVLAAGCLLWSFWPVPSIPFKIVLPTNYSPTDETVFGFAEPVQLRLNYPAYLRYGDIQPITAVIEYVNENSLNLSTGCDVCDQKHGIPLDIWQTYRIGLLFAFDQNNLFREPKGDTSISLAQGTDQQFSWDINAIQNSETYIKTTVYMNVISRQSGISDRVPVFANEHTIPVVSLGSVKTPYIRVASSIWLLSLLFITLINKFAHLGHQKEEGKVNVIE